jgi:hypothetical protein
MRFLELAAIVAMLCIASPARAQIEKETIALLPLDADKRLEPFGQPLAGEIGRVLIADQLDVVVVTANNTVPSTAKLVVYGALIAKGDAIVVQINVRNPIDGKTTDTLEEVAPNLLAVEATSIKLSQRLLPVVRTRLAALRAVTPTKPPDKVVPPPPAATSGPVLLVGIAVPAGASQMIVPFRAALTDRIGGWVKASKRTPSAVDASVLGKQLATQTVASARAERGVSFEILDYDVQLTGRLDDRLMRLARPGGSTIPLARARVRVRIADARKVVFDRVIATDTIVGDRKISGEVLADRVAREILTILQPHMRRLEPTW